MFPAQALHNSRDFREHLYKRPGQLDNGQAKAALRKWSHSWAVRGSSVPSLAHWYMKCAGDKEGNFTF
jgi:hypothetical protein